MIVIFDYNRTLFDPETGGLVAGAREAVEALAARKATLHLVSRNEPGRQDALARFGLDKHFASVSFVDDKEAAMRPITEGADTPVYVVGDHLHNEIRIGNRLGARTVWLKAGKFKDLLPEHAEDEPWRTIDHLERLPEVFAELLD